MISIVSRSAYFLEATNKFKKSLENAGLPLLLIHMTILRISKHPLSFYMIATKILLLGVKSIIIRDSKTTETMGEIQTISVEDSNRLSNMTAN